MPRPSTPSRRPRDQGIDPFGRAEGAYFPVSTLGSESRVTYAGGEVRSACCPSATLGEDLAIRVYVPTGIGPVGSLYLLHGRGETMDDWDPALRVLDALVAGGEVPPVLAVMPDAPWSDRAGHWVDSEHETGRPIESAVIGDLVPWVDSEFDTTGGALTRSVGGYSMGGAGAVRYLAAHPEVFSAAIALSPAVYDPLPPAGSSAREFGAFGVGGERFVETRYRELGYRKCLTPAASDRRLFLAHGDAEYQHPGAASHDIDSECAALAGYATSVGVDTRLRPYAGGHDWSTWGPAFADGIRWLYGGS